MPDPRRSDTLYAMSLRPLVSILLLLPAAAPAQQSQVRLADNGQWVEVSTPQPGTDAATIADARRNIAQGHPSRAVSILNKWIKKNKHTTSAYLPEAYLLRGRAKVAAGHEYKALYDFERVIREYPAAQQFQDAVLEEYRIALAYLDGLNRKLFGLRITPAERVGEEAMVRVAERLPGSRIAEQAIFDLGDYYYFRAVDLEFASLVYGILLDGYPNSRRKKEALARQIYANVARFKGPRYDASGLIEADVLIREFARRYPADARRAGIDDALRARIDESLAAQMLESARWYAKTGDKIAARFVLQRLQRRHAGTVAAAAGRELAQRIGITLDEPARPDSEPADRPEPDQPSRDDPPPRSDLEDR